MAPPRALVTVDLVAAVPTFERYFWQNGKPKAKKPYDHPDGADFYHLLWIGSLSQFYRLENFAPPSPVTPGSYKNVMKCDSCGYYQPSERVVLFHQLLFKHRTALNLGQEDVSQVNDSYT